MGDLKVLEGLEDERGLYEVELTRKDNSFGGGELEVKIEGALVKRR